MAILDEEGIDADHLDLSEDPETNGARPVLIRYEGSEEDQERLTARLGREDWVRLEGE